MATIDAAGKLTALADGKVTVTATAWDASGAKGTAYITISNQTTELSEKALADQISVYPNPAANGHFIIKGIENIKNIELVNLLGEKVIGFDNLDQADINVQVNVPEGIYLLNLSDGNHSVIKKIVVK
jgi:hypothetical protein